MRLLLAAALTTVLAAAPALAAGEQQRTIAVTGEASRVVPNDIATFDAVVSVRRATPAAALRAASARMRRVVAALESGGIAAGDLATQAAGVHRAGHKRTGYVATSDVAVTVHALARTARLIEDAVDAGATRIDGPEFAREDTDPAYREALSAALGQARAKAEALAADAGATLGAVQSITESGAEVESSFSRLPAAADAAVRPGRSTVSAYLTVVYAIS